MGNEQHISYENWTHFGSSLTMMWRGKLITTRSTVQQMSHHFESSQPSTLNPNEVSQPMNFSRQFMSTQESIANQQKKV